MNRTIDRLKLIFLGLFAAINVAIVVWEFGWAIPEQKCVEAHKWWDGDQRVCATPVLTSDITGRVITDPAARAAALKAIGRTPPPAQQP
ncbi:MAG: hypothetical protein ACJ798_14660 [Phenylobacterium sp.]